MNERFEKPRRYGGRQVVGLAIALAKLQGIERHLADFTLVELGGVVLTFLDPERGKQRELVVHVAHQLRSLHGAKVLAGQFRPPRLDMVKDADGFEGQLATEQRALVAL